MNALILTAAAAALALGAAASAHDTEKKQVRTVIVHKDGKGGHEAHAIAHGAKCDEAIVKSDTDVETDKDGKKQRTRVVICNSEGDRATATKQVIEALENARTDLAGNAQADLSAEHRTKALAALDAEIARLRVSPAK